MFEQQDEQHEKQDGDWLSQLRRQEGLMAEETSGPCREGLSPGEVC